MPHRDDLTLCMLAGGRSSRMGWPKSELSVAGQPIAAFILDRLQWRGPTMLVTTPGRAEPAGRERFDREVVDPTSDEGPLRGVHTALTNLQTTLAAIVTIDMPLVRPEQIDVLAGSTGGLAAMFCTPRPPEPRPATDVRPSRHTARDDGLRGMSDRRLQPFPCVLRRDAVELVEAKLKDGRRSVAILAVDPRVTLVDSGDDDAWLNLNTPGDVDELARRVAPLRVVVPPSA
jgi:molybdopterin-guanine dinucleotide biosynthesis protein A